MQNFWMLFVSFALIGLGAYGGGLVTIPLIQHEIISNRHWLNIEETIQLLTIAQMTPGPIAINAATFVGFRVAGFIGSIVATISVVMPSLTILALLAPALEQINKNEHAQKFIYGVQIGVLSLILFATGYYGYATIFDWIDMLMATIAFATLVIFEGKLHPAFVILACGIIGLMLY